MVHHHLEIVILNVNSNVDINCVTHLLELSHSVNHLAFVKMLVEKNRIS